MAKCHVQHACSVLLSRHAPHKVLAGRCMTWRSPGAISALEAVVECVQMQHQADAAPSRCTQPPSQYDS